MMWFVSVVLFIVSISLLRGNYSSMHWKVFNNTNDKTGYAKASGKPILVMSIGIAISGIVAVITSKIIYSVFIVLCVVFIVGIWFINIQKRFS